MRQIPKLIATQHPDNASSAYWLGKPFINTADEVSEVFHTFNDTGCNEYMWDWEGKHVDEAVIDRLYEKHLDFFSKNQLGRDVFLTYRLPNIFQEKGYRLSRAFINIMSADQMSESLGLKTPPIFECIIPMTDDPKKLLFIQQVYAKLAAAMKEIPGGAGKPELIEIIPLVEDIKSIFNADKIVETYINLYKKSGFSKTKKLNYLRPFIARSDPSLNYGLIPCVISVRIALSKIAQLSEKLSLPMFPMLGTGSLPFRGNFNPVYIKHVLELYKGVHTFTAQSAFRYDYPLKEVKATVKKIKKNKSRAHIYSKSEETLAEKIAFEGRVPYQQTVEQLADFINKIAQLIPLRRERKLHIGLFGYSRRMGKKSLPRAITFTSAFYSLGVPPELIGTGRIIEKFGLEEIENFYPTIAVDIIRAGQYLNKENLEKLSKLKRGFAKIVQDVSLIEDNLGIDLGPRADDHIIHKNLTSNIMIMLKDKSKTNILKDEIVRAGIIRKSLG